MGELIPADPERCQAEVRSYRPFVMGGPVYRVERCEEKPTVVVKELVAQEDGLCEGCLGVFKSVVKDKGMTRVEIVPVEEWTDD